MNLRNGTYFGRTAAFFGDEGKLVFQRDDFGSDVTTGGRGLLESVVTGESGHHVRMSGHEDPQADPGTSDRVSMRAMLFIRATVLPAL